MFERRAAIEGELLRAWQISDQRFGLLRDGALLKRPIALRHPFIFYLGHLPAFAHNQLRAALGTPPCDAYLDELFAFGIDPTDEAQVGETPRWPALDDILAYRDRVRRIALDAVPTVLASDSPDPVLAEGRVYDMIIEHELMHHETLLYMFAALDHDLKVPPPAPKIGHAAGPVDADATVSIDAGTVRLGTNWSDQRFAWDNAMPAQQVDVPRFTIDRWPVTNRAYRGFVLEGGYRTRHFWDEPGWAWRQAADLQQPAAWQGHPATPSIRSTFRDVPFDEGANWPVQVSHAEASAYARFIGARLPTEAEIRRAALTLPDGGQREVPWHADGKSPANIGLLRWELEPVGVRQGASGWGVEDLCGNAWEWTSSVFAPLPGFAAWARTYPGYSADFFDGRHFVLYGGSWATDARLVRGSFRNWFQPHYPHVFSKFRCVNRATLEQT